MSSLKKIKSFFRENRDNWLFGIIFKAYRFLCDLYYDGKNRKYAKELRKKYNLDKKNFYSKNSCEKSRLAVVAIFRGEDEYLVEWIEFHLAMGVSHFFLYDNGNSEESRRLLEPYVRQNIVTYIPFPNLNEPRMRNCYGWTQFSKMSIQKLAYGDCTIQYEKHFDWLLKIDIDEFVYPCKPYKNLLEVFDVFDKKNAACVYIQALRFGPSGHKVRTGKPVVESYDMRYERPDKDFKCAAKSGFISNRNAFHGCHFFFTKKFTGKCILHDDFTSEYLRLNHYYMKSKAEYADKIKINEGGYLKGKENLARWDKVNCEANFADGGEILEVLSKNG